MISDTPEKRAAELPVLSREGQTAPQPPVLSREVEPPAIPPKLKLSQILDSPSSHRPHEPHGANVQKPSQKIDSPSAMKPRTSRAGVDEFGTKATPIGVRDGQDLRKNPSGPAMHDPSSMHTRLNHPEQYKPREDTRLNPSGPRLKLSSERRAEREAADLKSGRGFTGAHEYVTRGDCERIFWMLWPERLRGAAYERYGNGDVPSIGSVLTMGAENYAKWGTGSLAVYGTPALYKGVFLRGWSKASDSAAWVAMTVAQEAATPPAKLDTEFVDGSDAYPWRAWRPTWDYPRAHT